MYNFNRDHTMDHRLTLLLAINKMQVENIGPKVNPQFLPSHPQHNRFIGAT